MSLDLEGLVESLVVVISAAGEQGCSIPGFLEGIRHHVTSWDKRARSNAGYDGAHSLPAEVLRGTATTLWKWLVAREDVSAGHDKRYNNMTFGEVLRLMPRGILESGQTEEGKTDASQNAWGSQSLSPNTLADLRLFVSEETMWKSLAGHTIDYKRLPRLEWQLLLGIASAKWTGILQADLGRLVDQDKRSVPKRTDSLFIKGYISKRMTIASGTRTSKLWLKSFVSYMTTETLEPMAEMELSRERLGMSREPVPWKSRWSGISIDYTALTTTIVAIVKEWGVLRMLDLKIKLGVDEQKWQMKIVAKICRALSKIGVVEYTAAMLENKLYKDCIRFGRDMNEKDWWRVITNKISTSRPLAALQPDEDEDEEPSRPTSHLLNVLPPWSPERPLAATVNMFIRAAGEGGLANQDICPLALGTSFRRYISSLTATMAISDLQPPHLERFQLSSRLIRLGKVGFYQFVATDSSPEKQLREPTAFRKNAAANKEHMGAKKEREEPTTHAEGLKQGHISYGFSKFAAVPQATSQSATLHDLCSAPKLVEQGRLHLKKKRKLDNDDSGEEVQSRMDTQPNAALHNDQYTHGAFHSTRSTANSQRLEGAQRQPKNPHHVSDEQHNHLASASLAAADINSDTSYAQTARRDGNVGCGSPEVGLTLPQPATKAHQKDHTVLKVGQTQTIPSDAPSIFQMEAFTGSANSTKPLLPHEIVDGLQGPLNANAQSEIGTAEDAVPMLATTGAYGTAAEAGSPSHDVGGTRGRGRGRRRGKGRGRLRGRGRGRKSDIDGNPEEMEGAPALATARPYICDMCGGSWKNDVGLKYHLEKSRTACNPNYVPISEDKEAAVLGKRSSKVERSSAEVPSSDSSSGFSPSDLDGDGRSIIPGRRIQKKKKQHSTSGLDIAAFDDGEEDHSSSHWRRPIAGEEQTFDSARVWQNGLIRDTSYHSCGPLADLHPSPKPQRLLNETVCPQPFNQALQASCADTETHHNMQCTKEEPQKATFQREEHETHEEALSQTRAIACEDFVISVELHALKHNERVVEVIKALVERRGGALIGGEELHDKLCLIWEATWSSEDSPTPRECHNALIRLRRRKAIEEHWHAYRASSGKFVKLQVILRPGMDPVSPFVTKLIEGGQARDMERHALHPDASTKKGHGRRRELAGEVARLSAPVYQTQVAEKRDAATMSDFGAMRKRQRRSSDASESSTEGLLLSSRLGKRWKWISQLDHSGHDGHTVPLPPVRASQFHILEPNTYLYNEFEEYEHQPSKSQEQSGAPSGPGLTSLARERGRDETTPRSSSMFPSPVVIMDTKGSWPDLNQRFFERMRTSFVIQGWMPDNVWFRFAGIADAAEEEIRNRRKTTQTKGCRLRRKADKFLERVTVFAELEASMSNLFLQAPRGAAGNNIFINLFAPNSGRHVNSVTLRWHPHDQLDLQSAAEMLKDAWHWSAQEEVEAQPHEASMSAPKSWKWKRHDIQSAVREEPGRLVPLIARTLTSVPDAARSDVKNIESEIEHPQMILAAFIAVRVLLGGAGLATDWGLLTKIFPKVGIRALRKFWVSTNKTRATYVDKLTQKFQDGFLAAYNRNELPTLDYDDPENYDWQTVISWTLGLTNISTSAVPCTGAELDVHFSLEESDKTSPEHWQERFFHISASVFSRFEAATLSPSAISLPCYRRDSKPRVPVSDAVIARSWVKSLCNTSDIKHGVEDIKAKLKDLTAMLGPDGGAVLGRAVTQLERDRIIIRSAKIRPGERPYRFKSWYTANLGKWSITFNDALTLKSKLDESFRRGETVQLPYALADGAVLALMNMDGAGRVKLVPRDLPHVPDGFEPGNYESRKIPKSSYHFGIEATPTCIYQFSDEIAVLRRARSIPPTVHRVDRLEQPQWVTLMDELDWHRFADLLGLLCFTFEIRVAAITANGACKALDPTLEAFEAELLLEWGAKMGVIEEIKDDPRTSEKQFKVAEWWWLLIPWLKRSDSDLN